MMYRALVEGFRDKTSRYNPSKTNQGSLRGTLNPNPEATAKEKIVKNVMTY